LDLQFAIARKAAPQLIGNFTQFHKNRQPTAYQAA
jgi:hypothetical protein